MILQKKSLIRASQIAVFSVVAFFVTYWAWKVYLVCSAALPIEYRDFATVQLTQTFASGHNPYSPLGSGGIIYQYGFLFSLLLAPIEFLSRIDVFLLHRIAVVSLNVLAATLVAVEARQLTRSWTAAATAFAVILNCNWNVTVLVIRPDSLGFVAILMLIMMARRSQSTMSVVVVAIGTVLVFYIKQYFVFISLPLVIYYFFVSPKSARTYVLVATMVGIVSVVVVSLVFPNYFVFTVLGAANSVSGSLPYLTSYLALQTLAFLKIVWPLVLVLVAYIVLCRKTMKDGPLRRVKDLLVISQTPRELVNSQPGLMIYVYTLLVASLCLVWLGTNDGAWLTYYFQLALPPLLLLALSVTSSFGNRTASALLSLAVAVVVLFGFFQINRTPRLDSQKIAEWNRAYSLLDEYRSDRMFLGPLFGEYASQRGLTVIDNGHTEYGEKLGLRSSSAGTALFRYLVPSSLRAEKDFLAFKGSIATGLRERQYSIVSFAKNFRHPLISDEDLESNYRKVDELELAVGGVTWIVEFWVPLDK